MRRSYVLGLIMLALVLAAPVWAGDAPAQAAELGQSIPAEAGPAAEAAAHDHSPTCGSGGACCSACQVRQKYAKAKGEGEDGGCPCQRARRAREQAAREQAATAD